MVESKSRQTASRKRAFMSETIEKLISRILAGDIRIPGFQRDYVWNTDQAALLMDSIYRGYPFGSLLLWRTRERLKTEKNMAGFELPNPEEEYPLNYVLDGQQRITSLFTTFQTELKAPETSVEWLPIYYNFLAQKEGNASPFIALKKEEVNPEQHFPLSSFFNAIEFFKLANKLTTEQQDEIVRVQDKFKSILIPIETYQGSERRNVATVFERINRQGVHLNTFQLLSAWTWSDEFDLEKRFREMGDNFDSFGFQSITEESDLIMKCMSAILCDDPNPTTLIDKTGAEIRNSFDKIEKALERTIDFLDAEFHIKEVRFLPYYSQLIPLAAFFAELDGKPYTMEQAARLSQWFWRTTFTLRYHGNPSQKVKDDTIESKKLAANQENSLGTFAAQIDPQFYTSNTFNVRTVATKAFILQLAHRKPRSFISGQLIDLSTTLSTLNRREYHHCFPKNHLRKTRRSQVLYQENSLANFAFLSKSENIQISDRAPSAYRELMAANISEIEESQLIPASLFEDEWVKFMKDRSRKLSDDAKVLMGL